MEKYIELSNEEIRLGFVSTCIESVAAALKRPYHEVFLRMKKTGMIRDYIYTIAMMPFTATASKT